MRLLDRYLLRELLVPLVYCLAGFLIFWISFDLLAQMAEYQKLRLKGRDLLDLYLVTVPSILVTLMPIAFLLALLYTLTNHARHHEITAIRAAGISLGRIALPYAGVGLLLGAAVFAMSEYWMPSANDDAEEILARHQTGPSAVASGRRQWEPRLGFDNHIERRSWVIENYHLFTGQMLRPHISWVMPDGVRRVIIAEAGAYVNGIWTFTNVHLLTYDRPTNAIPHQEERALFTAPEFNETPEQIRSEVKIAKLRGLKGFRRTQLSLREILDYERLHPAGVPKDLKPVLATKFHGQLAAPWTSLVVVAIALPFGARSGRRNVAAGVASSIFICFAYFSLQQLGLALGSGGHVKPWIAAWAPNLIFLVTGVALTWRLR